MDELYICLSDAFQKAKINFMKVKKIRHVKVPGFVLHCEEKLPIAKYFLNLTESCLKMNKLIDYRKSSIKPPGGLFKQLRLLHRYQSLQNLNSPLPRPLVHHRMGLFVPLLQTEDEPRVFDKDHF